VAEIKNLRGHRTDPRWSQTPNC